MPDLLNSIPSHRAFQRFNNTDVLNILAIDNRGIIIYANNAELASGGYSKDDYIGAPLSVFYRDELVVQKIFAAIEQSVELYNVESSVVCKDGLVKYVIISTRNLQDDTGEKYTYLFVRDISVYKKNENLLSYLNKAVEVLSGARDTKDALNKISALIVPHFANWFTIDVLKDGRLQHLQLAHEDPEYVRVGLEYREKYPTDLNGENGTALALKTGQPSFVPVVTDEMFDAGIPDPVQRETLRALGLRSVITVAMFNKEVITGVVTFISSVPGKPYDEADLRFAQNFANHIGLALENTRLNEEALAEIERRQKVEDELLKTQIRLNSALSSGLVGTWIRDLTKNIMYADESLFKMFGLEYTPLGIDPYLFINRIHPEDLRYSEERRKLAIDRGEEYEAEYRVITDNENVRWVFARGKTEFDANGNAVQFSGVVGDITERKKAELALKESEERFRLMAEAMPQKIFVTDSDAKVMYLNPQWEDFTGHSVDELNRLSLAYFIHPDDLDENLKKWREAVENDTEFQYEHRFRAKDGNYYWHLTRALSLRDADGKNIWIGSITDIHEQKQKEHKKDEFISIASHELKTPITSLRGYLQILSKKIEKEGFHSLADIVTKTHRQAHKLSGLISDLLDVSKMQAGKMNYNFTEFNLTEIVDDAITDAHNNYPSHKIIVEGKSDVLMWGDKHRLEQVLSNLLSNAAKYSPDANEIILAVSSNHTEITIAVQDFGVGIPDEKAAFIFNRFFRVEDTSYKFTGLGIGLYISHEIIQRHQGKLWFESRVNEGSTFTFRIPLKEEKKMKEKG